MFRLQWLEAAGADAVAIGRQFEFDHLRSHLREESGASRPGDELRKIQNTIALEHTWHGRHQSDPPLAGSPVA